MPWPHLTSSPSRRRFLYVAGAAGIAAAFGDRGLRAAAPQSRVTLPFENGGRELVAYPQKRPLIVLTARPPQLETPFAVFNEGLLTPNDAFFVRYHWSGLPLSIDPAAYRLRVGGHVTTPLALSLDELRRMGDPVSLVAVNQCSGNSRAHFTPRVNGGQLSNGAMGNARWTGVPLKRVLEKAGIKAGAVDVSFDGLDGPPFGDGPDFIKSLPIDHALDSEVMLAWQMNDTELPFLNGYPLRLVVPGYYGTYWVKHLSNIQVLDKPFEGFWVASAYRVPDNTCACVEPGTTPAATVPIGRLNVRSFITSVADGSKLPANRTALIRGIAFDGGQGIASVAFSSDGGKTWGPARLLETHGRYSFHEWTASFRPERPGEFPLQSRATNTAGDTQPATAAWNPAGYMRNVIETVRVTVT